MWNPNIGRSPHHITRFSFHAYLICTSGQWTDLRNWHWLSHPFLPWEGADTECLVGQCSFKVVTFSKKLILVKGLIMDRIHVNCYSGLSQNAPWGTGSNSLCASGGRGVRIGLWLTSFLSKKHEKQGGFWSQLVISAISYLFDLWFERNKQ